MFQMIPKKRCHREIRSLYCDRHTNPTGDLQESIGNDPQSLGFFDENPKKAHLKNSSKKFQVVEKAAQKCC
jgi:hypothetical protein